MKIFLKKILYLLEFLPKMPDDVFQLKLFRNHMRKVIFNRDNLYFLDNCNNNNTINVQENNKPNIRVITHDFSNTGAPKVTLDLCKKLKEIYDANIYIVGPSNGDLKEEFDEEKIDMSFVTSFSNAVGQIGNAVSAFASTDTESFKTKMDALNGIFSTNEDATSATNSIFSNVSIDTKPITDACDKAVMAIRAYRSKFVTAGQYMASGLAQGIKISASSARIAAENMARSALSGAQSILQIASPSKRTEEFGMYFSQGMAKGITAYSSAVTSASSDVSQQALNSVRASISGMSGLLDENVSSDPVIRPIVDLTNVGEGARAIRSMLSGGSTISVGSNVDNVREASASISRASANQNGSASGNIDNSSVNSNAVNLSGNNFYIRSDQDIRSLASEIASLSYQQKRGLGGHA